VDDEQLEVTPGESIRAITSCLPIITGQYF
jgi:hypothetical protein